MIIGDPTILSHCPHDDALAINEFWGFCYRCDQMVQLVKIRRIPLKNELTRELPRPRQDSLGIPPFNTSESDKRDC